jgi:predicted DsbA family dithiol-disulfide isomerase
MIQIDVYSDLVCPWCFVGKRRLERAVAGREKEVEVVWRPFELNPAMPQGGMAREEYRQAKFGSLERSRELEQRVIEAGRTVDLPFEFGKIKRTPNTFDGHRLMWLARREGRQNELAEQLFRAYFLEGRDLGDRAVLSEAAERAGVDARGVLEGDGGAKEVRREEAQGAALGVQGVPFFVFAGRVALSGAQAPETILEAIQSAAAPR